MDRAWPASERRREPSKEAGANWYLRGDGVKEWLWPSVLACVFYPDDEGWLCETCVTSVKLYRALHMWPFAVFPDLILLHALQPFVRRMRDRFGLDMAWLSNCRSKSWMDVFAWARQPPQSTSFNSSGC